MMQTVKMLTEAEVRDWLLANPQFLQQHPEVLAQHAGDNVLDFQQHMLGRLQDNLREMSQRYEGLIVASRDNMSTQSQVHQAVIGIVRAKDLEHLLQMLTQDLVQLFDVDRVCLALESPAAGYYAAQYGGNSYLTEQGDARSGGGMGARPPSQEYETQDDSGFTFIEPGMVDAVLGKDQQIRLIADLSQEMDAALQEVFTDSLGLIRSCALIRMSLPDTHRQALLIFGVRHAERFHPHQGVELLHFLAQVVEYKLDACLIREGIEEV